MVSVLCIQALMCPVVSPAVAYGMAVRFEPYRTAKGLSSHRDKAVTAPPSGRYRPVMAFSEPSGEILTVETWRISLQMMKK